MTNLRYVAVLDVQEIAEFNSLVPFDQGIFDSLLPLYMKFLISPSNRSSNKI